MSLHFLVDFIYKLLISRVLQVKGKSYQWWRMAGALENEGKIIFWNNQIKSHVTPDAQFILIADTEMHI